MEKFHYEVNNVKIKRKVSNRRKDFTEMLQLKINNLKMLLLENIGIILTRKNSQESNRDVDICCRLNLMKINY